MTRALASGLLCASLTGGCAGGATQYACPGYPGQPLCLPPSDIYRLSNGLGPPPAAEVRPPLTASPGGGAAGSRWAWMTRIWN